MEDSFGFIPVFTTRFQIHYISTYTTELQTSGFRNQDYKRESGNVHDACSIKQNVLFTMLCLNLFIQNSNKNTSAACLKKIHYLY